MANQWFRMYAEFATDTKVQMMSEVDQRRFVMVLCMYCACNDGVTLHDDEIAFQLRISNEQWSATKAVFIAKNLLNEDNRPAAWDKRQFVSDSSTERVARHREKKKQGSNACNVTETPPEAEADTEVNPPTVVASSSELTPYPQTTAAQHAISRKGIVCGLLRKAGMADAAPHYLAEGAWEAILAKRTDEEIVELARAKMAARPGQRTGLKYIAPALLEDPEPIAANARASPGGRRQTIHEKRAETIAALTGRSLNNESHVNAEPRDITAEAVRIA